MTDDECKPYVLGETGDLPKRTAGVRDLTMPLNAPPAFTFSVLYDQPIYDRQSAPRSICEIAEYKKLLAELEELEKATEGLRIHGTPLQTLVKSVRLLMRIKAVELGI